MSNKNEELDKKIWELMGNTFYSVFFALLFSALVMWDKGIFNWSFNERSLYSSISIFMVLMYFLIDWLDANLAPTINPLITKKDIFTWLVSALYIFGIAILIIRNDDIIVVFMIFFLLLFYSFTTTIFRDKRLDIKKRKIDWLDNTSKAYDETMKVHRLYKKVLIYDVVIFIFGISIVLIHSKMLNVAPLQPIFSFILNNEIHIMSILIIVILFTSLRLKYKRNKFILIPLYHHRNVSMKMRHLH